MLTLNDGRSELWQWDTGRTLTVDTDCSQVHFSNKVFGRSIDVNVANGVAIIPDVLLQTDNDLNVWAFSGTAENGYTKISKTFKVNRRNKPADYVFTPVEQTTLEQIKQKIDYLESIQDPDAIKNAVDDYLERHPVESPVQSVNGQIGKVELTSKDVGAIAYETDPTVPGWAKQPEKPTYTAAEVGALPDTYTPPVDSTLTQSGQAADAKAVGDAINRVNSAIEAKQDHLTEHDKQEVVLTGLTTGAVWTATEKQKAWGQLAIIRNALDDGIAVAGAQYYLGERKIVSIVLPDDAWIGQMITVSWYNGNTAATLSITGAILSFDYTPSANTRSEINALWDGTYWALLGNEMAVPSEVAK